MLTPGRLVPKRVGLPFECGASHKQDPQPCSPISVALCATITQPTISALRRLRCEDNDRTEIGRLAGEE